jgi:NTE family protein
MSDYVLAVYVLILESLNRTPLIPADWERTISVSSVGISPRIRRLSDEQKAALINSGEMSTKIYFDK